MNAVVLGSAGSIGSRHVRNLRELGVSVSEYDPAIDPDNAMPWYLAARDAIVVVASPTAHHFWQTLMAMGYGARAVYVEKPPAQHVGEWRLCCEGAEDLGVQLAVGFQWRFHPAAQVLREIGPIRRATFVALDDFWHWPTQSRDHLLRDGVLACSGSHTIDLVYHLYGQAQVRHAWDGYLTSVVQLGGHDWNIGIINSWASPGQYSVVMGELADGRKFEMDFLATAWREATEGGMHRDCMKAFVNWADGGERDPRTCSGEEALNTMGILDECQRLLS